MLDSRIALPVPKVVMHRMILMLNFWDSPLVVAVVVVVVVAIFFSFSFV